MPVEATEDGRVLVSGNGQDGQLGTGDVRNELVPVYLGAFGPTTGHRVCQVACGEGHTIVRTREGIVFTWGRGTFGQLGHGETQHCFEPRIVKALSPEALPLDRIIRIAAAGTHTASITICIAGTHAGKNAVYTWGSNEHGQLGSRDVHESPLPVLVQRSTELDTMYDVLCTATSTSVFLQEGGVHTWGTVPESEKTPFSDVSLYDAMTRFQEDYNQLVQANQSFTDSITHIASGEAFGMASSIRGNLYVWGSNDAGQLGLGVLSSFSPRPVPVPLFHSTGFQVQQIACGNRFALAVCNGRLYSWGDNSRGQLGLGLDDSVISSPELVLRLQDLRIVQITAGCDHAGALVEEMEDVTSIYLWGDGQFGQLGQGRRFTSKDVCERVPCKVGGFPFSPVSITTGLRHTAIMAFNADSKHVVLCCGDNTYGQIGFETSYTQSSRSFHLIDTSHLEGYNIVRIAAGGFATAATLSDGSIAAWGLHYGLDQEPITVPTRFECVAVKGPIALCDTAALIVGHVSNRKEKQGNYLVGMGSNMFHKLGIEWNDHTADKTVFEPQRVYGDLTYRDTITELAFGSRHAFGLTSRGDVFVWGHPKEGRLGQGDTNLDYHTQDYSSPRLLLPLHVEERVDEEERLRADFQSQPVRSNRRMRRRSSLLGDFDIDAFAKAIESFITLDEYCTVSRTIPSFSSDEAYLDGIEKLQSTFQSYLYLHDAASRMIAIRFPKEKSSLESHSSSDTGLQSLMPHIFSHPCHIISVVQQCRTQEEYSSVSRFILNMFDLTQEDAFKVLLLLRAVMEHDMLNDDDFQLEEATEPATVEKALHIIPKQRMLQLRFCFSLLCKLPLASKARARVVAHWKAHRNEIRRSRAILSSTEKLSSLIEAAQDALWSTNGEFESWFGWIVPMLCHQLNRDRRAMDIIGPHDLDARYALWAYTKSEPESLLTSLSLRCLFETLFEHEDVMDFLCLSPTIYDTIPRDDRNQHQFSTSSQISAHQSIVLRFKNSSSNFAAANVATVRSLFQRPFLREEAVQEHHRALLAQIDSSITAAPDAVSFCLLPRKDHSVKDWSLAPCTLCHALIPRVHETNKTLHQQIDLGTSKGVWTGDFSAFQCILLVECIIEAMQTETRKEHYASSILRQLQQLENTLIDRIDRVSQIETAWLNESRALGCSVKAMLGATLLPGQRASSTDEAFEPRGKIQCSVSHHSFKVSVLEQQTASFFYLDLLFALRSSFSFVQQQLEQRRVHRELLSECTREIENSINLLQESITTLQTKTLVSLAHGFDTENPKLRELYQPMPAVSCPELDKAKLKRQLAITLLLKEGIVDADTIETPPATRLDKLRLEFNVDYEHRSLAILLLYKRHTILAKWNHDLESVIQQSHLTLQDTRSKATLTLNVDRIMSKLQ